jgi:ATP-dependent Clp protease ATP-binding subunit ClpC
MLKVSRPTFYSYHIELNADGVLVTGETPDGPFELPEAPFLLTKVQESVEKLAAKIQGKTANADDIQQLGEQLYYALFGMRTELGAHFRQCLASVTRKKGMLRVTLDLDEADMPEVAALPWEALRAPQEPGRPAIDFATDPRLTLSRKRKMWTAVDARTLHRPLRIQLVVANPVDSQLAKEMRLGPVEYETVWNALKLLSQEQSNLIAPLPDPLLQANASAIEGALKEQPDILHFIGHGRVRKYAKREVGQLALIGVNGLIQWTNDTVIADLFKRYQPALVLLQSCEGGKIGKSHAFVGVASQLVHQNVPTVLAMQYPVRNVIAASIARTFYEFLALGESVDKAVQEVRRNLHIESAQNDPPRDAITPVLFSRLKNGQLFEPASSLRKPVAQPFSDVLLANVPYPVAIVCSAYNRASETVARFVLLDAVLVNSVKFLAILTLSQYRGNTPDTEQMRTWLAFLAHPRLSGWARLLGAILDSYEADSPPAVTEILLHAYRTPLGENSPMARAERHLTEGPVNSAPGTPSPETFLNQIISYREKTWGDQPGRMDTKFCAPLVPILQLALQQLWETFAPLASYSLRFITRVDQDGDDWVYTGIGFRGSHLTPIRIEPFHQTGGSPHRTHRLYLCDSSGQPLLNLHPFLAYIELESTLYFIDYNDQNRYIQYLPCGQGEPFIPPSYFASFMLSLFQQDAENPVVVLQKAEAELDKLNADPPPITTSSLTSLLARLDTDAHEALELALGEGLRLGHFWLGVEFLLMGLSRQKGQVFPALLDELNIDPGELRGLFRTFVEVVGGRDWRQIDVAQEGHAAFERLQATLPASLAARFVDENETPPQITPRMLTILQHAADQAKEGQISPRHLLAATLLEQKCLAVTLFMVAVHRADWSPDRLQRWIATDGTEAKRPGEQRADFKILLQPETPPVVVPFERPAALDSKTVLGRYGRDLTAEASRSGGSLHSAEGKIAHQAMVQMGRILIQREANNPILLGDPGVGKTAIVEGFAMRLASDPKVITQLANRRIIQLTVTDLLSGTTLRGNLEDRLRQLLAEVRSARGGIVVFIDEIHTILGGKSEGSLGAIADALKPALARGEFPCIGASTVKEYRQQIEKDAALTRRFTPVWIEEPGIEEAIEIVQKVATKHLAPHHGVNFPPEAIKQAVELSARYLHQEYLPGKAIKILDQAASTTLVYGSLSGSEEGATEPGRGEVSVDSVLEVIASRTNIPITQLGKTDKRRLRELEEKLKMHIKGQDMAVEEVVQVIQRAGTGLSNRRRPLGVFLFAGPTGVGKTELARTLTEALFDDEAAMLRLDMSEYMEKHQVSRLIGAPPGYVGYEEEGQLTGHLRRHPYCVVLLDEMEKAHEDVQHLFLQLFDNGRLTDAHGMEADGRNAIFIMTTNLKTRKEVGFVAPNASQRKKTIEDYFSVEFRNRMDCIVDFQPLSKEVIEAIFEREFRLAIEPLLAKGIQVSVHPDAQTFVCSHGVDEGQGARLLRRVIERLIITELTHLVIEDRLRPGDTVRVGIKDGRLTFDVDWGGAR